MKHLKIILAISLAANVLLVGVIAGQCSGMIERGWEKQMAKVSPELSGPQFAPYREAMQQSFEIHKKNRGQMRELHRQMMAILSAPVLDENAYRSKLQEITAFQTKSMESMMTGVLEASRNLSSEDRKKIAYDIRDKREHMRGKFRKPD